MSVFLVILYTIHIALFTCTFILPKFLTTKTQTLLFSGPIPFLSGFSVGLDDALFTVRLVAVMSGGIFVEIR